jgi:hypothetical protein
MTALTPDPRKMVHSQESELNGGLHYSNGIRETIPVPTNE